MKTKISILLLLVAFAIGASAQSIGNYIDVLYLKNGSKIKGVIVEQIPGKSVKIKTADGSEFVYAIQEVEKFTREESAHTSRSKFAHFRSNVPDSLKFMNNFKAQKNGYFFLAEGLMNSAGSGARITNGYRFGRFGNIGLAIGLEAVSIDNLYRNYYALSSVYYGNNYSKLPVASLNIVYSGEILNKRITPFYQVEAGYGFSLDRYGYNREEFKDGVFSSGYEIDELYYYYPEKVLDYGGPMGAIALGLKFHTKKKVFFKLSLDARFTSNFSDHHTEGLTDLDLGYSVAPTFYQEFNVQPGLGARLGIGF